VSNLQQDRLVKSQFVQKAIQLPPLSSPKSGPPQKLIGPKRTASNTVIYALQEEDTRNQSRRLKKLADTSHSLPPEI
jgi:hypothetical protein